MTETFLKVFNKLRQTSWALSERDRLLRLLIARTTDDLRVIAMCSFILGLITPA